MAMPTVCVKGNSYKPYETKVVSPNKEMALYLCGKHWLLGEVMDGVFDARWFSGKREAFKFWKFVTLERN